MSKNSSNSPKIRKIFVISTVFGGIYIIMNTIVKKKKEPDDIDKENPYIRNADTARKSP